MTDRGAPAGGPGTAAGAPPAAPLRVAYDAAVLGTGSVDASARTGVFRVVEAVARGLAAEPAVELRLVASTRVPETVAHCAADPVLRARPVAHHPLRTGLLAARAAAGRRARAAPGAARLLHKGARELLGGLGKAAGAFLPAVPRAALAGADLYHSPFHPFPEAVRSRSGLARVMTVYDLIPVLHPELFEPWADRMQRQVLASLDEESWVLCISEATRDDLLGWHRRLDPARVAVTPLGAAAHFHPEPDAGRRAAARARYGIPPGVPYLLTLSTLEPRKNLDAVIRAFFRLAREERLPDLHLVLVGTRGWDYGRIFAELGPEAPLARRVVVTGFAAEEDLPALYSDARLFAYPSLYEGFGLPVLEAMQCGVPVVASRTSSLPEVVGEAGLLVDPRDEAALAEAMLRLLRDGALREELSRRSLERARLFSWEAAVRATVALYRKAAGARG